jgi:hypothetical protein
MAFSLQVFFKMNDVLGAPIMTRCSGYREPKPSKRRTAYEDIFAPFPASASREKAGKAMCLGGG